MLLTALQFPERIAALIGISSTPDFTEDLIFKQLSSKQKEELDSKDVVELYFRALLIQNNQEFDKRRQEKPSFKSKRQ